MKQPDRFTRREGMWVDPAAWRKWTAPARIRPSFLVIGAQRSGSTSLFRYLAMHPCILPALRDGSGSPGTAARALRPGSGAAGCNARLPGHREQPTLEQYANRPRRRAVYRLFTGRLPLERFAFVVSIPCHGRNRNEDAPDPDAEVPRAVRSAQRANYRMYDAARRRFDSLCRRYL